MPQRQRSRFGNTRQLPSGKWQARFRRDDEWHHAPKTFWTKTEAQDWLDDAATDTRRGTYVNAKKGNTPLREWVDTWKANTVGLRASTAARDFGYVDWYILPTLGDMKMNDLDHLTLTKWVATLSKERKPATVAKALAILKRILGAAVTAGMIPTNPAIGVKPPKIERDEMRFLSVDEVVRLADVIDARYRSLVYVGAYGGLRASEMFGLTWGKVDAESGVISITSNLVEVGGRLHVEACKTRASRRVVQLPRVALSELLRPSGTDDDGYVWPAPNGGPTRIGTFRPRVWKPATKAAGLDGVRIHDLRHTCAGLLLAAGANPLEVSRTLGHAGVAFTLSAYGHLAEGTGSRVAGMLDRLAEGSGTDVARLSEALPDRGA